MSQALLFTSLSLPNTERVLFICLRLSAAAASLPFSRSLALPMRLYGCACVCRFRWLLSGSPALFLLFFFVGFPFSLICQTKKDAEGRLAQNSPGIFVALFIYCFSFVRF